MRGQRNTRIPPTAVVRRPNAKKWHLRDGDIVRGYAKTLCGSAFRVALPEQRGTIHSTTSIGCEDCMIGAIRRAADRRLAGVVPKVTP